MKAKYFWIKKRFNPQLGTYYAKMGPLPVKEANSYESYSLYGSSVMLKFESEDAYNREIIRLGKAGKKIH